MSSGRIGLLGGTFDPVHYGHLQLAESALKECKLDKVVFIPSAQPPHKNGTSIASFNHRLAMLSLATQGITGFECNAIEGILPKPSYTIDTLRELQKLYSPDCQLYFLIGADAFLDILTWKSHHEILRSVNIILSHRKGYKSDLLSALLKKLNYKRGDRAWHGENDKKDIFILEQTPVGFSSSDIRRMISSGESVHRMVPEWVDEYIQRNQLYQLGK